MEDSSKTPGIPAGGEERKITQCFFVYAAGNVERCGKYVCVLHFYVLILYVLIIKTVFCCFWFARKMMKWFQQTCPCA